MVARRHRTLRSQTSKRSKVHWVQHLSRKADTRDQSHWMEARAGRNVAGRVDTRMGQQVDPLSQMCVGRVAREQVIAFL
jgi:hypothetical protein